ncbi:MAG: cytochrome c3 family protein [Geobacteraceae bacterium]|nr:cytochrome c3 family protein [Geobacteraceae bacterium]
MSICRFIVISACLTLYITGNSQAAPSDIFSRKINPAQDKLVFPNSKGEVIFTHSKHLISLKRAECILCHKIENPTLEKIQSRFDNHRVAHSFCKGCHLKLGMGPTECHQCHNYKKST